MAHLAIARQRGHRAGRHRVPLSQRRMIVLVVAVILQALRLSRFYEYKANSGLRCGAYFDGVPACAC
eukprot:493106-Pyramimonas_sp.AAC.2